jgi:8-oxo-dGTP pyrophosphatase MutT (NUDIX family)
LLIDYQALKTALGQDADSVEQAPPDYRRNAVCLLLFDHPATTLLLIQKADRDGYPWRDQVALPGGGIEPTDRDAEGAALREVREELGIDRSEIVVLGTLGHFQTKGSKDDLEVFVARWMKPSALRVDHREIARVLDYPLARLVKLHLQAGYRSRSGSELGDALVYELPDVTIWGVTARILHRLVERVLDDADTDAA